MAGGFGLAAARGFARGVGGQVVIPVLVVAIPLLTLLLTQTRAHRDELTDLARLQAARTASLVAAAARDRLLDVSHDLWLASHLPALTADDPEKCHRALGELVKRGRGVISMSVVDADGRVRCNSRLERPTMSLARSMAFLRATDPDRGGAVAADVKFNRLIGRPSLVLAQLAPHDTPLAGKVVAAAIDLDWLSAQAANVPGGESALTFVIDAHGGDIIGGGPDGGTGRPSEGSAGGRTAGDPSAERAKAPGALLAAAAKLGPDDVATVDAADSAGVERLWGVTPLLPGETGDRVLAVGLERNALLAAGERRRRNDMLMAVLVASVVGAAAVASAMIGLLRPLRGLTAAARRLDAGDLAARVDVGRWPAHELRTLGETLNALGATLESRNRAIEAAHARVIGNEANLRLLAEHSSDLIVRLDADLVRRYVSPAATRLLGHEPAELTGRRMRSAVHAADWPRVEATLRRVQAAGAVAEPEHCTFRSRRREGNFVWLESSVHALPDGGLIVIKRDVARRKQVEERLEQANRRLAALALEDALTGLANRRRFDDALTRELRRAGRVQEPLGLLMIDVDRFKMFNDRYGHPAGDAALRAVAQAIDGVLRRPGDLACRYGGEEIAVLLPTTDRDGAGLMGARVVEAVRAIGLAHADGCDGIVTVSVGAASVLPLGEAPPSAAQFLHSADAALYDAKQGGRDQVRVAPPLVASISLPVLAKAS